MRNPVRGESDAFYIAFGSALLIGASAAVGALLDPLVGVALYRRPDRCVHVGDLHRATRSVAARFARPLAGPAAGDRRMRVLVIANRTLGSEALRNELRGRGALGAELHLVAPILSSRAHYIASDIDGELLEARERLDDALAWSRGEGLEATGRVGDPNARSARSRTSCGSSAPTR